MLMIHPNHPGALAIMDAAGQPQFVAAERVLEMYDALRQQVADLETENNRLRGGILVDDIDLSWIVSNGRQF